MSISSVFINYVFDYGRSQCEELRSTLSRRQQDQIAAERTEQMRQKEVMMQEAARDEKMFADLW